MILIVKRWSTFLPPLHNFTVSRIHNIGVEFERLLKQAIINDDARTQFGYLSSLYGKLCSYSFGIIEAVQRAVNKEPLLFRNYGRYSILENACCNEGGANTNHYFVNKESSIRTHNNTLFDLEKHIINIKIYIKSIKYSIPLNTKIVFPRIQQQFSKLLFILLL